MGWVDLVARECTSVITEINWLFSRFYCLQYSVTINYILIFIDEFIADFQYLALHMQYDTRVN